MDTLPPRNDVQQPKQSDKVIFENNPIPNNCLNDQMDARRNILMDTFLRCAPNKLKTNNIDVSFDDLKKGDLKKLCDTTASLLMGNHCYLKLSGQTKINGHQIQERLRILSKKVKQKQVSQLHFGCFI